MRPLKHDCEFSSRVWKIIRLEGDFKYSVVAQFDVPVQSFEVRYDGSAGEWSINSSPPQYRIPFVRAQILNQISFLQTQRMTLTAAGTEKFVVVVVLLCNDSIYVANIAVQASTMY